MAILAERHDGMLHGDEVPLTEVSRGAVVPLTLIVVGVELDETRLPLTNQPNGQQSHLMPELLLDVGDQPLTTGSTGQVDGLAAGAHRHVASRALSPDRRFQLVSQRADLRLE